MKDIHEMNFSIYDIIEMLGGMDDVMAERSKALMVLEPRQMWGVLPLKILGGEVRLTWEFDPAKEKDIEPSA